MLPVSEQSISGKWVEIGEAESLFLNRSILLRKRIMDFCLNHLLFTIESKSAIASCIWFCVVIRYLWTGNNAPDIPYYGLRPNIDHNWRGRLRKSDNRYLQNSESSSCALNIVYLYQLYQFIWSILKSISELPVVLSRTLKISWSPGI